MFKLFVGDVTSEVCQAALAQDKNAVLVTADNFENLTCQTCYTSLADCGSLKNLSYVCNLATDIIYVPPSAWSDVDKNNLSQQQQWTEHVLYYYQQSKTVDNLPNIINTSWLYRERIAEKQFWTVGCSITAGDCVEPEQAWPALISKKLNLPYTNLSCSGSSIIWQSDQICRADIQSGDIVFWGVTSNNRLPIIVSPSKKIFHLHTGSFKDHKNIVVDNNLYPQLLQNDTLMWYNMLSIRRAYNYCSKIGAKLVPLGLMYDFDHCYLHYDIPSFFQLIQWGVNDYVDLGTDGVHPGPEQHKLFADAFLSHYRKIYI